MQKPVVGAESAADGSRRDSPDCNEKQREDGVIAESRLGCILASIGA
jgi:hypothetical protein